MWPKNSGIALALDVENRDEAFRLLDRIAEHVDIIKFNYPLILAEGLGLMTEIKKRYPKPILADFKVADVPVTNDRIARLAANAGADGLMLHGFIGVDAIQSLKAAVPQTKLFIVTQMTNPGGLDFTAEFTDDFAELARTLELAGVQAPGNRPEVVAKVRKIVGPELMIVCCGIGAQGGAFGGAIAAGADYEIVGRAIYRAADPLAQTLAIKAKIRESR